MGVPSEADYHKAFINEGTEGDSSGILYPKP